MVRFPEHPTIRLHAASSAWWREELEQARQHVFDAVALAPEDPYVLTHAASLIYDLDDYAYAQQWARVAADLAPDDFEFSARLLHLTGKLLWLHGEEEYAEQTLRQAFEADPVMPGHARVLAVFLENRDRFTEALEVIDEGLRALPGDEDLTQARERILAREATE